MGKLWVSGFFLFFTFATTNLTSGCFEHERGALLRFKNSLANDLSEQVSSWNGNNCCHWEGIDCDNATGHVTSLDLGGKYLYVILEEGNEFDSSLAELTQLRYLNLSSMGFFGIVPQFIGNLSNLRVLDLSNNMDLVVDDFTWLWSLLSLKHLDLSGLSIVKAPNFAKKLLYMISSLPELRLSDCDLSNSHFYDMHLNLNLTLSPIQKLDLSSNSFQGEFPLFLQNLTMLRVLDLSHNQLNSSIPVMKKVVDLNLEQNRFRRFQDTGVWRLCQLKRLALSSNFMKWGFTGPSTNVSECAQYDLETPILLNKQFDREISTSLGRLTALRQLDLSYNYLTGSIPEALGDLTSLQELHLSNNDLTGSIPTSIGNLMLLRHLDFDSNLLNGKIPSSLGRLSNLERLHLTDNCFSALPLSIGNLSKLQSLDISCNCLQGPLPSTIGRLSELKYLDISNNNLSGVVIEAHFTNASKLNSLDISNNSLSGAVTEAHFTNTSMLKYLNASKNHGLSFKISPDWNPPFQIIWVDLQFCKIESQFPPWIQTQKSLETLVLSNTGIFGPLPNRLRELPVMGLLDLSHNFLIGPLTNLPSNLTSLSVMYPLSTHTKLLVKNNLFTGPIPESLCNVTNLIVLDLSINVLSGTLPKCFENLYILQVLILSSNRLSGVIPSSFCNIGRSLIWLSLDNNSFRGQFPKTLANCSDLAVLDFGENRLFGSIPKWIGENITSLKILRLHKNSFTGPIPVEWCKLSALQIMDLGENKLTGTIPRCFQNLSGMIGIPHSFTFEHISGFVPREQSDFEVNLSQVMKGVMLEYTTTLKYVVNMDLSSNKLLGEIPKDLVLLSGLLGLNLSNNHLTGRIPDRIGDIKSLESLDLSLNDISGMIPQSMSALTFLSHLNLSHNKLSGRIPTGRQLQTFIDPSIYTGNNELCGSPLPVMCNRDEVPQIGRNAEEDEDDDGVEMIWIYGATIGFTTGFMGIIGILVLKNRWRLAIFNFVGYYIGKKL